MNKLSGLLLLVLLLQPVLADGMYIPKYVDVHLQQPQQKAVIVWDGETETLIVSAYVTTDKISEMVWILPIESETQPEFNVTDAKIFADLAEYLEPEDISVGGMFGGTVMAGSKGVQVIATEEVDIYDILVLKATDSQELVDWLNEHGYTTPQDAVPLFDRAIQKNSYFIINTIDLGNKYANKIAQIPDFESMNVMDQLSACLSKFGGDEFCEAIVALVDPIENQWFDRDCYKICESTGKCEELPEEEQDPCSDKWERCSDKICSKFAPYPFGFHNYGLATPLLIRFKPPKPVYPLILTSIFPGEGIIDVYVLSKTPVSEDWEILTFDTQKTIDAWLHSKLAKYLPETKDLGVVSRFRFEGAYSGLTEDAYFTEDGAFGSLLLSIQEFIVTILRIGFTIFFGLLFLFISFVQQPIETISMVLSIFWP